MRLMKAVSQVTSMTGFPHIFVTLVNPKGPFIKDVHSKGGGLFAPSRHIKGGYVILVLYI